MMNDAWTVQKLIDWLWVVVLGGVGFFWRRLTLFNERSDLIESRLQLLEQSAQFRDILRNEDKAHLNDQLDAIRKSIDSHNTAVMSRIGRVEKLLTEDLSGRH